MQLEASVEQPLFTDDPFPYEKLSTATLKELIAVWEELGVQSPIK